MPLETFKAERRDTGEADQSKTIQRQEEQGKDKGKERNNGEETRYKACSNEIKRYCCTNFTNYYMTKHRLNLIVFQSILYNTYYPMLVLPCHTVVQSQIV